MERRRTRRLKTPGGRIMLHDQLLTYLAAKPERARFADFILPTLTWPWEIWLTRYSDDHVRHHYIAVFDAPEKERIMPAVLRLNTDGTLVWNAIPSQAGRHNERRIWDLIDPRGG